MRVVLAPGGMYPEPRGVPLVCPGQGLGPQDVAAHLAAGWARARPGDGLTLLPLPDGAPGTTAALPDGVVAERQAVEATGPLGLARTAELVRLRPPGAREGREDLATSTWFLDGASVLALPPQAQDAAQEARRGTSAGLGLALGRALERTGPGDTLVVGLARSAVLDAGAGLIDALGGTQRARSLLAGREVLLALADLTPLGGLGGAGQGLEAVTSLSAVQAQDLDRQACAVAASLLRQVLGGQQAQLLAAGTPTALSATSWGTGAGGGSAMVLRALGARALPGARIVAELVGLQDRAEAADLLVTATGEAFDIVADSVAHVVGAAAQARALPAVLVAGRARIPRGELAAGGIAACYGLEDRLTGHRTWTGDGPQELAAALEQMGSRLARTWSR